MAKLVRKHQKIFADSAVDSQLGKIGSAAAGSPERTRDIEEMQELAEYERGYFDIVSSDGDARLPFSEDLNSLLHIPTRQLAYLMQAGVAEWDPKTHYYENSSIVQYLGELYISITGDDENPNVGNTPGRADSDGTNVPNNNSFWKLHVSAFPVGSTYIQFPGENNPAVLGMPGVWKNTSTDLNGAFIRFEGYRAGAYDSGQRQPESFKQHYHKIANSNANSGRTLSSSLYLTYQKSGAFDYSFQGSSKAPTLGKTSTEGTTTETRPTNYTVRKWKRIS